MSEMYGYVSISGTSTLGYLTREQLHGCLHLFDWIQLSVHPLPV